METNGKGNEKNIIIWVIGLIMSMTVSVPVTKAGLISVIDGINAPASTLGPYVMTPFPVDTQPIYAKCLSVISPLGRNIKFNIPLEHRTVDGGWLTWSHGYTGDVYWTGESIQSVGITMPYGTSAFYFYAQPNNLAEHTVNAVAYDGVSDIIQISQDVDGNMGASYYGFYGTDGSMIHSIMIYSETTDFSIGEFGISMVPAPEAVLLSNIGFSIVMELKRQRIF